MIMNNHCLKLQCVKPKRSYLSNSRGKYKSPKRFKVGRGVCMVWMQSSYLIPRKAIALACYPGCSTDASSHCPDDPTCHGLAAGLCHLPPCCLEDSTCQCLKLLDCVFFISAALLILSTLVLPLLDLDFYGVTLLDILSALGWWCETIDVIRCK